MPLPNCATWKERGTASLGCSRALHLPVTSSGLPGRMAVAGPALVARGLVSWLCLGCRCCGEPGEGGGLGGVTSVLEPRWSTDPAGTQAGKPWACMGAWGAAGLGTRGPSAQATPPEDGCLGLPSGHPRAAGGWRGHGRGQHVALRGPVWAAGCWRSCVVWGPGRCGIRVWWLMVSFVLRLVLFCDAVRAGGTPPARGLWRTTRSWPCPGPGSAGRPCCCLWGLVPSPPAVPQGSRAQCPDTWLPRAFEGPVRTLRKDGDSGGPGACSRP